MASKSLAIPKLASAVFDKGRRGMPLPGCDCIQCFGYCHIDSDARERHKLSSEVQAARRDDDEPLA